MIPAPAEPEIAVSKPQSKGHIGYWRAKVYRTKSRRGGGDYSVKIQHGGRRHSFQLATAEVSEAAAKARDIYLSIVRKGWDEALLEFRPGWELRRRVATFGDYFDELAKYSTLKPRAVALYRSKVFRLLAGVARIKGMKGWKARCGMGREDWMRKLRGIRLSDIQDHQIVMWQNSQLRMAGSNPLKCISRTRTLNTYLRALKSIFSVKLLRRLSYLSLPDELPGRSVSYLPDRPNRYRSTIDAQALASRAVGDFKDSNDEALKAFLLSLLCGLRKSETDLLLWRSVDWAGNRICVEPNEYHDLKTYSSEGFVYLESSVMSYFRRQYEKRIGEFVLGSKLPPRRHETVHAYYRAKKTWQFLTAWLRRNGLDVPNPVHTLRKEFGSLVARQAGIYAASRALRHSSIQITASVYVDTKDKPPFALV